MTSVMLDDDHPITIERNPKRVVVSIGGTIVADSSEVSSLQIATISCPLQTFLGPG
jgi:uncharacterized protein (DUF427 family)